MHNGHLNRLLIQPFDPAAEALRADVRHMLENEGIWVAGDSQQPELTVPIASMGGKVFALHRDQELDPARLLPTLTLAGPFTAQHPAPDDWTPCAGEKPAPLQEVLLSFPGGMQRVGQWNPAVKKFTPPRADRFFKVEPTHWRLLPSGPRI